MAELDEGMKKIQKMIDDSREKQITADYIIKELSTECDAACQAERAAKSKLAEMEKKLAEKPEKEIVHHKIAPWVEDCPDCDYRNPFPVPKSAIKTKEICSNCKSPVLDDWEYCPECDTAL